jgi:arginine exporter protein ArgO
VFVWATAALGVAALLAASATAAIAVLITATWFVTLADIVGSLRAFFTRRRVRCALDAGSGAVLIGLGVRLAATAN